jgi:hypothetical protein
MFTKFLTKKATPAFLKSPLHFPPLQAKNLTTAAVLNESLTVPLASKRNAFYANPVEIPDTQFFSQLKSEENKQFSRRKRTRFDYENNYSAAISLPYSTRLLVKKQNDLNALLALSQENIIEHANRRVDLFFYTLIAYYKTAIFPTNGHTNLQHGRGRAARNNTTITEACHSSFTPSLLDNNIYQTSKVGAKRKRSLLSDTHFMDNLNATVELPPFVNHFDDYLESICRQKCMDILCDVSLGTINPIEGLTRFLKMMNDVLNDLKQNAAHKSQSTLAQYSLIKHQAINPQLIDLVLKGTLYNTFCKETETVTDVYIQLLLRITPIEKLGCSDKDKKELLYMDKMMSIQNEILHTRSQHHHSP